MKPAKGLTDEQIKAAFDPVLASKGLTKVASETADLLIEYQFGVGKTYVVSSYGSKSRPGSGGDTDTWQADDKTTVQASTVHEGNLYLYMYETTKHTLAWRGVAVKTINTKAKPNERQQHLVEAVKKLMEHYPPVPIVRH